MCGCPVEGRMVALIWLGRQPRVEVICVEVIIVSRLIPCQNVGKGPHRKTRYMVRSGHEIECGRRARLGGTRSRIYADVGAYTAGISMVTAAPWGSKFSA